MPELPEVETVKRQISPAVKGRTILSIESKDSRNIKKISFEKFKQLVSGDKILNIERRAKYLLFKLKSGRYMVVHLGMAGRVLLKPDKYVKIIFNLSGRKKLYFSDTRLFGKIWLYDKYPELKLGPEPLEKSFTLKKFKELIKSRKGNIKIILMDQKFIAGIGNIYAAEALFLAGIHPKRRIESLTDSEISKLYQGIQKALKSGIMHKGTSVTDFVGAIGEEGKNQNYLYVYGRKGKPCKKCEGSVDKITLGQRGTYFCPKCQHML
ncbi:DNA-formamidopyrimidine glycosylase [candidate division WOR-1 bacterium RIFOXYA12_FULL_43_27]|uniref:Formamidopyrimidine-DNA glycosylase n=1 Tax=candidate division WOR-1 bacterium RIFOXYC2_FULL_46_14 TaxID=1802587 RepID=A0A1F4U4Z1_UNCSA|nr:MAG: DNA-formamidopyrimidine glycosylase [candidate division WOR-1 bacterium RIFOXYA12_FULL_43_27]OGC20662.1 MAG: DNA-formamidopyrimidine glycosylase [candidate division WOR-1 bacterium RIFOXYB2_FULL_46_45]OGC31601.1 MAG: DNA-formamidopyrimidine glycosylase [candidate division WOR-1 bacterium RIFOXYA2_FULL_46_56]OGC40006.1 MAG: DNA-formamidopyrimidine glycosylase [candidate division WOR-1 bacterium RIFOXYC2_FULL_46_14]